MIETSKFQEVPMRRLVVIAGFFLWPVLLATAQANAQPEVIRIGVAMMKNASAGMTSARVQQDALVRDLKRLNPKRARKGEPRVEPVPLQGTTPEEAGPEARDKNCDLVVYTTLLELRSQGERLPRTQPNSVEAGPDPLANHPPPSLSMDMEYRATLEYRIQRAGRFVSGAPLTTTEGSTADAIVSSLMDRVAAIVYHEALSPSSGSE
jgi:hypothetical protein